MTEFIDNGFSIDWKVFKSATGYDLAAILSSSEEGGLARPDDFEIRIDGVATDSQAGKAVAAKYQPAIAARFKGEFLLLGADFSAQLDRNSRFVKPAAEKVTAAVYRKGKPIGSYQDATLLDSADLAMPSKEQIQRVAGPISDDAFLFLGAAWYANLLRLAEKTSAKILKRHKVLDWGCGCGRISRHFIKAGHKGIAGIDTDPVNIAWMQKQFGSAFRLVDVAPPTDYEPEQFDVIFGHSVFTHLAEAAQFAWLGELKRLLKPGGRAYVTICSEKGVAITGAQGGGNTKDKIAAVIANGIFDFGHQNVGVDVNAPGYYRLIAHTHDYVTRRWSAYLDVKQIVSFFAAQQDMVVLEKPVKLRKRK